MSYIAAAETILRTSKRSLTTRELTEAARRRGLIQPTGATPDATMSAALYTFVKNNPDGPIRREYTPGSKRAVRDSVRWVYAQT